MQKSKQRHQQTNQLRRVKHHKRQNYSKQDPCKRAK